MSILFLILKIFNKVSYLVFYNWLSKEIFGLASLLNHCPEMKSTKQKIEKNP